MQNKTAVIIPLMALFLALGCQLAPAAVRMPHSDRMVQASLPTPSSIYSPAPTFKSGAIIVRYKGTSAGDEASHGSDDNQTRNALDDYDETPASGVADPLEPWNRFWFHFNDIFYLYIAKPAYRAWEAVIPGQVHNGLKNFFHNVLFPTRFVNNILQCRFKEAGVEFGRFFINTTTTLGFADITKEMNTVVPVDPTGEDFGQTLGWWGIGHGIYLVWPLVGPSSARETVGRIGDIFTDPFFYVSPWELATGTETGLRFNALDSVLPLYDDLTKAAVDPYIAMREAYIHFRNIQVAR